MMPAERTPIETCRAALTANGFEVFVAKDPAEARQIFFTRILPNVKADLVSWADSLTMEATGVLDALLADPAINMIKTFDPTAERGEIMERRRQALLVDLFLTGSNAVTECGKLVNLDMIGNRTGGISFGPKKVVLFIGQNKIVPDLQKAMERIKNHAAPLNAKRHNMSTPCAKTGRCHDCSSPQRICNTWAIVDKCYPKGRIKVVLIEQDLGI
ncbi:lactate utilization protein [Geopsychrobacter electrodiphilus]|uniref:lactate utilization protein n=1 Tax=Geopsychrobacter electrodiphilus TaxID=225196 RepID=UPI000381A9DC|nr:lactate utilization protein [Geopsychrobacter electrodiphilus]